MTKIAVFGAGTWGIALARLLAVNGRDVTVWSAIPAELKSLSTTRRHPNLPGMELPSAMHYTADIAEACTGRDILLFAVPSPFVRSTAKKAAEYIPDGQLIVDVAKGVEDKTLMTMSEIIEDELAKAKRTARVVALSGPTHAEEVARDMPTLIVAASEDEAAAKAVQKAFTAPSFRVYTNTDRRGTELGGAVKNVIALAVGIALGLGYGDNAKAALITRGNAELTRLGLAMGCKPETFAGLSGCTPVCCWAAAKQPRKPSPRWARWSRASTPCPPSAALPKSTRRKCPSCKAWTLSCVVSLKPAMPLPL